MSWDHWGIKGYGLDVDDIMKYVNKEKVNKLVREINPRDDYEEDVFEDDTFFGCPYSSFAEFLSDLDDTNTIIWEDGGENDVHYVLYPPKYPWQVRNTDPLDFKDIEDRIINALLKVCDCSEEDIRAEIQDIDDYGCG